MSAADDTARHGDLDTIVPLECIDTASGQELVCAVLATQDSEQDWDWRRRDIERGGVVPLFPKLKSSVIRMSVPRLLLVPG